MKIKQHFIAGLVILLPLTLTIAIVLFIFNFLTAPFVGFVTTFFTHYGLFQDGFLFFSASQTLYYAAQLLILLVIVSFTLFLGVLARGFLFHYFLHFGEYILHRIPIINVIYKISQDIIKTIFSSKSDSFKKVVLLRFPNKETYSIGLITRESLPGLLDDEYVAAFVPTTPNPTSGYLVMVKREDVVYLDISVEEAMKYVISCGVVFPKFKKNGEDYAVPSQLFVKKQDRQDMLK